MPSIIDANCCPQGCPWENGGYCGEKLVDMQKGGYCQNQGSQLKKVFAAKLLAMTFASPFSCTEKCTYHYQQ